MNYISKNPYYKNHAVLGTSLIVSLFVLEQLCRGNISVLTSHRDKRNGSKSEEDEIQESCLSCGCQVMTQIVLYILGILS